MQTYNRLFGLVREYLPEEESMKRGSKGAVVIRELKAWLDWRVRIDGG